MKLKIILWYILKRALSKYSVDSSSAYWSLTKLVPRFFSAFALYLLAVGFRMKLMIVEYRILKILGAFIVSEHVIIVPFQKLVLQKRFWILNAKFLFLCEQCEEVKMTR